jgi:hypothetical protein
VTRSGSYIFGMHTIRALAVVGLAWPALASADCYQLFDRDNRLVLQSSRAPVDLSRPSMSEEVARVYPGHVLIVASQEPCDEIDELSKQVVKLPARSLDRGPVRIASDTDDSVGVGRNGVGVSASPRVSSAGRSSTSISAAARTSSTGSTYNPPPTCYIGPKGGTYTITKSGNKNYKGC